MKQAYLLLLLFFLPIEIFAQHRSIDFMDNLSFPDVLKAGAKEKKLIFVDCYTSWCIPCRGMQLHVFTQDSVADFFNTHFVNFRMDMEKAGKPYARIYQVESYPTFLLLDSTGKAVYKFLGGMNAADFLKKVQIGMNPKNRVEEMNRIFQSGSYSNAFLRTYIKEKLELQERIEAKRIAKTYFEKLTPEERLLPENWFLFDNNKYELYLSGVKSDNFNYLLNHWADFVKLNGKKRVFGKISHLYRLVTSWTFDGWYFRDYGYSDEYFVYLKNKLMSIPLPYKDQYLSMMDMNIALSKGDTALVSHILNENIGNFTAENQQILFDYMAMTKYKRNVVFDGIAKKVLASGKPSNLLNYLLTLYPDTRKNAMIQNVIEK